MGNISSINSSEVLLFILLSIPTFASSMRYTTFSTDIVVSACHVVIDDNGTERRQLILDTFKNPSCVSIQPHKFTVRLY